MELPQERATRDEEPFSLWVGAAGVAVVIAAFVDVCCAWVVPVVWITPLVYELYTACGSVVLLLFVFNKPEVRRMLLLVTFIVAMVVLYKIPWSTRKPFLMALDRVRIGMTAEEVDGVMGGYIRGSGWPAVGRFGSDENGELVVKGSIIYRHSDYGMFNSDWGLVEFNDGKVTGVEFLPD
jgi:hypothetical protein